MKTKRKPHRNEVLAKRAEKRIAESPQIIPNKPVDWLPKPASVMGDEFLESYAWRRLRMIVLKRFGTKCMCCGATPEMGAVVNVDHIKPRRLFPHLALDIGNLQVLCNPCNHGKGNWDMTDWRPRKYRIIYPHPKG